MPNRNQYQHECTHGFLRGWCHICPPDRRAQRRNRPRLGLFASAVWALVLLCLPLVQGCAALGAFFGSPAGQAAVGSALSTAMGVAARQLESRGVDLVAAPACFELDGLVRDDDDVGPAEVCFAPWAGVGGALYAALNEIAVRRLAARGLQPDKGLAFCERRDLGAVPMVSCVYPAVQP